MIRKSLDEFQQYCDELKPKEYIFNLDNQTGCDSLSVQAVLRFNNVVARSFTRRIMFSGEHGFMCFNNVEHIEIAEDNEGGVFFNIICHRLGSRYAQTFVMLAD